MSKTFELSPRYFSPTYWWVATELVRRNPQLELLETYPMDGFYDCLTLHHSSERDAVHIDFNRFGSIHVHPEHIGFLTAADIIGNNDAHWAVKRIEQAAGLVPSDAAPASNARMITLRLMTRVVNYLVNDRSDWALRMMTLEGYNWSVPLMPGATSSVATTPLPEVFPTKRQYHSFSIEAGLPDEFQEGRFWALQRDQTAVALFDIKGFAYTKHARTALKPLYARFNRNLTQTMAAALADVLP